MKARKKHQGTKARVQAHKKRLTYIATTVSVVILIAIIALSAFLIYSYLNSSLDQTNDQPSQLKAAIVDHLSLTAPNQTFIQKATNTLKQAGYTVDYYPGEKVNVEFYRNLPTHDYNLIILRVHSAAAVLEGKEFVECPVGFFTSEPYSRTKYIYAQLTDQLVIASYTMPEPPYYFAILPKFVTSSMKGKFQNTIIVMMGCEGLNNTKMAEAFIEKGAKVYISWSGMVSASHTDQATTQLLKRLITEKRTLKEAVRETFKEVGFDPAYESLLIYYPLEAGDQTVEDITGNPTTKP